MIRGSLLQMRRYTSDSTDYIGLADPKTAEAFAQSYGRLTPADVLIATRNC